MSISALEATSFIGRRRELGELRRALASSRSVTLIGIGGVGKTRLAQCLLHQLRDDLDGRVWTVDLGQEHDPDMVQLAVAAAMGLRPQPGEQQVETICGFLGDARAVLALDNCEHLLDACAALTSDLLAACPGLRVVATSRQALGIAGERVYRVPPLSVPDFSSGTRAQDLAEYESVALFVGRAHDAFPDFELTDENAESVAQLCVALEGIPLAMELAAARTRVLSPEAMLDRLEQRYQLLARGYVDVPNRQRSLEASVEWSYDLCTPQEQLLWARLSVFSGGFDLDAAEIVCADDDLPADDVLDVVSSLVEKSLVFRDGGETHPHFRLLETIRQFGAARLALADDPLQWERRHQDYFSHLTAQFHERWLGPDQPRLVAQMRRNHANLRSVFERTVSRTSEAATALQMVADLEEYWFVTGLLSEARHWTEAALAHSAGTEVQRATALSIAGYLTGFQMQAEKAAQQLTQARAELERSEGGRLQPDEERDRTVAWARLNFAEGIQALNCGELAAAVDHSRRCIELSKQAGEMHSLPAAYAVLGVALSELDQAEESAAAHAEVLAITEPLGELHMRGLTLWALSVDAMRAGDLRRAEMLARSSLDLHAQLGDEASVALALECLASVAARRGDGTRSATVLGAAMALWERVGLDPFTGTYVAEAREVGERAARAQLGDRAFEAAFQRGCAMPLEHATDYALGRTQGEESTAFTDTPLTTRERQVAALIGEGLSNQQIASRLQISVRTAQGHVENILRKLGFSSRTQVATWVVSRNTDNGSSP